MAGSTSATVALERPESAEPARVMWTYSAVLITTHLLALLAVLPWLFSWTGVFLVVIGHHVFGMLGTTLGFHRLLTHRGFTCPLWFEHTLAILGTCCLQDSPARWVAMHRQHHQHSDERTDPHSPLVEPFWGHMKWLMVENREHHRLVFLDRYARDLLQDPFYIWLERHRMWLMVYMAHAVPFFVGGFAVGAWTSGQWMGGLQFGLSLLVWGVFVRTVAVWHFTWSVNSLTSPVRLSHLRHRRQQPQQLVRSPRRRRRRLAQQPSCRAVPPLRTVIVGGSSISPGEQFVCWRWLGWQRMSFDRSVGRRSKRRLHRQAFGPLQQQ